MPLSTRVFVTPKPPQLNYELRLTTKVSRHSLLASRCANWRGKAVKSALSAPQCCLDRGIVIEAEGTRATLHADILRPEIVKFAMCVEGHEHLKVDG
jgi:hypothetical protein